MPAYIEGPTRPVLVRDGADTPPLTAALWSPATIHLDGPARPLYIELMAESIRPAYKGVLTYMKAPCHFAKRQFLHVNRWLTRESLTETLQPSFGRLAMRDGHYYVVASKSGSLSKSKAHRMALGHEKLDVYRLAIGYVAWVYEKAARLEDVHRAAVHPG